MSPQYNKMASPKPFYEHYTISENYLQYLTIRSDHPSPLTCAWVTAHSLCASPELEQFKPTHNNYHHKNATSCLEIIDD